MLAVDYVADHASVAPRGLRRVARDLLRPRVEHSHALAIRREPDALDGPGDGGNDARLTIRDGRQRHRAVRAQKGESATVRRPGHFGRVAEGANGGVG